MFKISYICDNCGDITNNFTGRNNSPISLDEFEQNYDGYCPHCGDHHGNVYYSVDMTPEEFVEEISKLSAAYIAKHANLIVDFAKDIIEFS